MSSLPSNPVNRKGWKANLPLYILVLSLVVLGVAVYFLVTRAPSPSAEIQIEVAKPTSGGLENCSTLPLVSCAPPVAGERVGGCSKCQGNFKCYTIDNNSSYENEDGKRVVLKSADGGDLPPGSWCLPFIQPSFSCNQYTGLTTLARFGDEGYYRWVCSCRYPQLFTNVAGLGSDCTQQVACGHQVNNHNYITDFEGGRWTPDSDFDPASQGKCKCDSKYVSDGLKCKGDMCYPGKYLSPADGCCCNGFSGEGGEVTPLGEGTPLGEDNSPLGECQDYKPRIPNSNGEYTSFLNCPTKINEQHSSVCSADEPQCIKDPCNPHGYYDYSRDACMCKPPFVNHPVLYNSVGNACVDLCSDDLNPCPGRAGSCSTKCVLQQSDDKGKTSFKKIVDVSRIDPNNPCSEIDYEVKKVGLCTSCLRPILGATPENGVTISDECLACTSGISGTSGSSERCVLTTKDQPNTILKITELDPEDSGSKDPLNRCRTLVKEYKGTVMLKPLCDKCLNPYSNEGDETKTCRTLKLRSGDICSDDGECWSGNCRRSGEFSVNLTCS